MSFNDLKVSELKKVAETFGVELGKAKTKEEIIASIVEEGIAYSDYEKFSNADKPEIKAEKRKEKIDLKSKDAVLVKMERTNHSYMIEDYTFTQEHPFVAMTESDAQRIFDTQIGFRPATPRELQEFYN